jgi:N-acetylglucosaminyldiphosphoundecaprenol N-acetyl-beta-D-mannosaminyltransferase
MVKTYSVLGTPLAATDYDRFTQACQEAARLDRAHWIEFSNTHVVAMRRHDPQFRSMTGRVDHFVPDGMPLVWCLNLMGAGLKDRVYGPTFMRRCILASPAPFTHYFLGGSEACQNQLLANLRKDQPELRVLGARHDYSRAGEPGILNEINQLSPDFIWVALGTPKQQEWAFRNVPQIRRGVVLTVGFAFDVNAGTKRDAPLWMQQRGLTWLFRIVTEPRRLLFRYLQYNSLFLSYLLWDGLRGRALRKGSPEAPANAI